MAPSPIVAITSAPFKVLQFIESLPLIFSLTGYLQPFPNPSPRNCRSPQTQPLFGYRRCPRSAARPLAPEPVGLCPAGPIGLVRRVLQNGRTAGKRRAGSIVRYAF